MILCFGTVMVLVGAERLLGGPAQLEAKDYKSAPQPVVEQPCNWTGFYVGIHGGYGWGDLSMEERDDTDPAFRHEQQGFFGGGQVGYNLQLGSMFVIGVEGEFAGSDIGERTVFRIPDTQTIDTATIDTNVDWMGTVAGRVGLSFWHNRLLAYGKGGAAFTHFNYEFIDGNNGGTPETFRDDEDRTVGLIGGGLEYALTCHWSVKFEYKHYFFDSDDFTVAATGGSKTFDVKTDLDSVQLGVNFKF